MSSQIRSLDPLGVPSAPIANPQKRLCLWTRDRCEFDTGSRAAAQICTISGTFQVVPFRFYLSGSIFVPTCSYANLSPFSLCVARPWNSKTGSGRPADSIQCCHDGRPLHQSDTHGLCREGHLCRLQHHAPRKPAHLAHLRCATGAPPHRGPRPQLLTHRTVAASCMHQATSRRGTRTCSGSSWPRTPGGSSCGRCAREALPPRAHIVACMQSLLPAEPPPVTVRDRCLSCPARAPARARFKHE